MELQLDINSKIVAWLSSMGYPVSGMPVQLLRGMLLREARQWQVSPERLEMMILEDVRGPQPWEQSIAPALREAPVVARLRAATARMQH